MDYNETDYDYNDYPQQEQSGSVKGLKIAIVILIVILAAISFQYWRQVQDLRGSEEELLIEKDTLTNRLTALMGEMGNLRIDNDTMNVALAGQRHMADSLMQALKKEKSMSYRRLKQYERELGTLRTAMQGFVRQIDSLNQLNQKLVGENMKFRKEMAGLKTRTEAAEETASEQANKLKRASVIKARDISLVALNKRDKPVSKAKQAEKLVASCVLSANEVSIPGERPVYVRIITPDGDMIGGQGNGTFTVDGETKSYSAMRNIDYQGDDIPVSVFVDTEGLYAGKYTVMVYIDGFLIGMNDIILK